MKRLFLSVLVSIVHLVSLAQDLQPFTLTDAWLTKIDALAPKEARVSEADKKNILIFSLHTGYEHWNIPHTAAILKLLGEKSNKFTITLSKSIQDFKEENLEKYHAVILNNTCSKPEYRNLFYDVYIEDKKYTPNQALEESKTLENNILNYVKRGHGLMIMHGGIVMQNKSAAFGEMVGGSFDYHPKQQPIHVKLVDPNHPLVAAFKNEGFTHVDEPYFFKDAYFAYNFRPLLYMDANELVGLREDVEESRRYVAWAKEYGNGRIFYSSPSHNPQSFENPELLQFFLDGMQFVVGDLACDLSPIK